MVAVEGKFSPRILGGKRRRRTTSVSSVASVVQNRPGGAKPSFPLCPGGENIRSIPVVQSSESAYTFVSSCLCGEKGSVGTGVATGVGVVWVIENVVPYFILAF